MTYIVHCQRAGETIEVDEGCTELHCPCCNRLYGDGHENTCCFTITEKINVKELEEGTEDIRTTRAATS